ncbi:hypothetical protein LINPERHAP2_LOCUS41538 [Linum perenne]
METETQVTRRRQLPILRKNNSWSPDSGRENVWRRRKSNQSSSRLHRSSSNVTDEDVDELNACIELGFGFDPESPDLDPRLSETLPALGFYCAVHKQYNKILSRTSSEVSDGGDSAASPIVIDPMDFFLGRVGSGEDPEMVKMKLKQWAKVVGCSVKQLAGN